MTTHIDIADLAVEPDTTIGELQVFLGDSDDPSYISTPGRCVSFNTTDEFKAAVRYIVRYWDVCEEAEARGES